MIESLDNLVWVALVAVVLAMVLRSRGMGTALPLLLIGIAVGSVPWGPHAPADPEIIQAVVLAPLVFGEALNSSYVDIRKVGRPVLLLAVGLVAVCVLVVGGVTAALVVGMPLAMAMALGAVLSPTDAVAVAAAARRANLPRRVVSILEGESLVNDGSGLTALRVATAAAVAGSVTLGDAGWILAQSVVVGVLVGVLAGWALIAVLRHSSDIVGFGGLLLIAPFVIYIVAEEFDGSSILAIVIAALMASHASHADPTYRGRLHTAAVWRQITFILQSIAFLLLGLELPAALRDLPVEQRPALLMAVPAVVVTLIVVRMVFVLGAFGINQALSPRADRHWSNAVVVGWAGARGPVSALAAFSIPLLTAQGTPLPYRDFVVAAALLVIAITLALAPTLGPVARWVGARESTGDLSKQEQRVRAALGRASLAALESAQADAELADAPLSSSVVRILRQNAEQRMRPAGEEEAVPERTRQLGEVGLAMAQAEQQELLRLRTEEGIPDAVVRPLLTELDRRIATLRAARGAPPPE